MASFKDMGSVLVALLQLHLLAPSDAAATEAPGADSGLPPYGGPKPPWPYKGFERFPSLFFGANESGLENPDRLELAAKHQVAGWGWQQNHHTVRWYNGTYYQQETSLAQMASRLAAFVEFSPPRPERQVQAVFVYRHMEVAEYYFSMLAAAFHDPRNKDMFLQDAKGRVCWKTNDMTGPFFNFSNQQTVDWFVEEVGGELTREADIQAVFFDETDWLYCGHPFNNCSHNIADEAGWQAQYRNKMEMMRQLAAKLNAAGIWPIYSTYNGFKETPYRACAVPFDEYYEALANVGWFRFYEFGIDGTGPGGSNPGSAGQFRQALRESQLGLPVIVHATPQHGNITLPLALFLLAQNEYWYFAVSTGWVERNWQWWPEFDKHYGRPLAPATQAPDGSWNRKFEACEVTVSGDLKNASIVFTTGPQIIV